MKLETPFIISIHALVKRATTDYFGASATDNYFNPRPREEGDFIKITLSHNGAISIHALVKRATKLGDCYKDVSVISIHALVKRATVLCRRSAICGEISIHALVKRATQD